MKELLEKCMKQAEIASIYTNENYTEKFFAGYVAACNDEYVLIEHFTPNGLYDGYILIRTDALYRVDFGGKYGEKIGELARKKNQMHQPIEIENEDILFSILKFAKEKNGMVCLEFEDTQVTGLIRDYSDANVELQVYDDYGDEDGITISRLDEIGLIAVDSSDEQDIAMLSGQKLTDRTPEIYCSFDVTFENNNFSRIVKDLKEIGISEIEIQERPDWISMTFAVVNNEPFWDIDDALTKMFSQLHVSLDDLKQIVENYQGEIMIDIAFYHYGRYPALEFSGENMKKIHFLEANISVDAY